jgi:hypothetical protein
MVFASSWLKNKSGKNSKKDFNFFMLVACLAYSLPQYGNKMFLQKVAWLSTDYTALYPGRLNSSFPPL